LGVKNFFISRRVGVVDGVQPIIGEQLHCSDTCSVGEPVVNEQ